MGILGAKGKLQHTSYSVLQILPLMYPDHSPVLPANATSARHEILPLHPVQDREEEKLCRAVKRLHTTSDNRELSTESSEVRQLAARVSS